ncbi:MAG: sensor domain-containing diguanylate cyclase [Pseudomonadota bacterium]
MQDEYQDLVQFMYQAPVGLCQTTLEGAIQFSTPMAAQLLMPLSRDGSLDNLFDVLGEIAPELRNAVIGFEKKRGRVLTEHRCPIVDEAGRITGALAVTVVKIAADRLAVSISDVSSLVEKENEAAVGAQMLSAIGRIVKGYEVCALDPDGRVADWNASGERLSGHSAPEIVGRPFGVLVVDDDARERMGGPLHSGDARALDTASVAWTELLEKARDSGQASTEGLRRRKSGEPFWAETTVIQLHDAMGAEAGFSVVTRETTAERAREQALVQMASVDPLTGALNRRAFFEMAQFEADRLKEQGGAYTVAMMDLDHFKRLNDRHGHAKGDAALKATVAQARAIMRETDLLGRFGGEEFVLFFGGMAIEAAAPRIDAIRAAIAEISLDGTAEPIRFTASFGAAGPIAAEETLAETIERADAALYEAKAAGRNRLRAAGEKTAQSA